MRFRTAPTLDGWCDVLLNVCLWGCVPISEDRRGIPSVVLCNSLLVLANVLWHTWQTCCLWKKTTCRNFFWRESKGPRGARHTNRRRIFFFFFGAGAGGPPDGGGVPAQAAGAEVGGEPIIRREHSGAGVAGADVAGTGGILKCFRFGGGVERECLF